MFSSDPARCRTTGELYRIDPDRAYPDLATKFVEEAKRPHQIDFVSIVTPNHFHLLALRTAIASGVAVMSDKPATATATLAEARVSAKAPVFWRCTSARRWHLPAVGSDRCAGVGQRQMLSRSA